MKIIGDFHTHTRDSDGRGTITRNVAQAEKVGLKYYGVSDHGLTCLVCHQTIKSLKDQSNKIEKLQQKSSVKIFRGLEANIIGFDGKLDVEENTIKDLDILLFGFHRFIQTRKNPEYSDFILKNGFGSLAARKELVEKNTTAFIKTIEKYPIDIVCHLSHRAMVDFKKVCEAAKANNCYVELNEKHIEIFENGIDAALKSGVNFILGSDAHKPQNVGKFERVEKFIINHHIPEERIVGIGMEPKFKNQ